MRSKAPRTSAARDRGPLTAWRFLPRSSTQNCSLGRRRPTRGPDSPRRKTGRTGPQTDHVQPKKASPFALHKGFMAAFKAPHGATHRRCAMNPIRGSPPSEGVDSKRGSQAKQEVGPEGGKPPYLGIALVQQVLNARRKLKPLQIAVTSKNSIGPANIDPCVPAVEYFAEILELLRHHVDLGKQGEAADRLPDEADVPTMRRLPRKRVPGRKVF